MANYMKSKVDMRPVVRVLSPVYHDCTGKCHIKDYSLW